jgi:cell division protein FtsB
MAKKKSILNSRLFKVLMNRYLIASLSLLVWLSFFDRNDFLTTFAYRKKLNELRSEMAYYENEIGRNRAYIEQLETNPENLERFAREKYLMKKDNEDIFVILDERKPPEKK